MVHMTVDHFTRYNKLNKAIYRVYVHNVAQRPAYTKVSRSLGWPNEAGGKFEFYSGKMGRILNQDGLSV